MNRKTSSRYDTDQSHTSVVTLQYAILIWMVLDGVLDYNCSYKVHILWCKYFCRLSLRSQVAAYEGRGAMYICAFLSWKHPAPIQFNSMLYLDEAKKMFQADFWKKFSFAPQGGFWPKKPPFLLKNGLLSLYLRNRASDFDDFWSDVRYHCT